MRENSSLPMQQKRYPRMALIRPRIADKQLVLDAPDHEPLVISLDPVALHLETTQSTVCGSRVQTYRVLSSKISGWLSSVLAVECYLACDPRLLLPLGFEDTSHLLPLTPPSPLSDSMACTAERSGLSFANEAQILLVTSESAQQVSDWIAEERGNNSEGAATLLASGTNSFGPLQYRPNIVVRSTLRRSSCLTRDIQPFEELRWSSIAIGKTRFQISGPCRRCQMISIDQESSRSLKEPYSTLARKMRVNGKVVFGVYLDIADDNVGTEPSSNSVTSIQSDMLISVSI
ncbi:hypothetical protein IWW38_005967 [Coemansia aciculifera]|uniref:Uncharacterized protein n=1 Tax=Coemansia aciculifera TaxID=417176 RepID=A0ACC1LUZ0_9FUNG|nr:hypothetical protein IWW38_005967 [Coemansia aciculifera]